MTASHTQANGRQRTPEPPQSPASEDWRLRLQRVLGTLANIPIAFRLAWDSSRTATLALGVLTLVGAALPAAQAWVAKLIVDSVVDAIGAGLVPMEGLRAVFPFLLLEFGLILTSNVVNQLRSLAEHVIHGHLNNHINTLIMRKALALDLSFFENATFYNKLENARREADWRALRTVNQGLLLVQNALTLLSLAGLMLRFSPWLVVLIFGATIPSFLAQNRYASLSFRVITWRAPEARRLNYFEYLLTNDASAKEVKLFGLGAAFLHRYQELFWKFFREDRDIAVRRSVASVRWGLLSTLSYYVSFAWVIWQAVAQVITLGDMTMYIAIFRQAQNMFQAVFRGTSELYEHGLFMDNLLSFLNLEREMVAPAQPRPLQRPIRQGIEFQGVTFRYPGTDVWALRGVDLHIRPREKLALVGANGAGKTTLIKLLTRLYDPTEGRILLDGVDLRDYDPDDLRRVIGVIFQDFVRYHLVAAENIGLAQIDELDNYGRIHEAARKAGADAVIAKLPYGYATMLGRWFAQGHDLSGGEWQKIALARAFMRDAEILVLDEPTASLDAQTEYEIFQRFRELTADRIAILISHRFSTVRMADRIAVVEEGQISELGGHHELLAHGGTYARLFNMQAVGYR